MRRKSLYGSGNLFKVTASKIKLDIEYNDGWQHTPVIGNPFSVNSNFGTGTCDGDNTII